MSLKPKEKQKPEFIALNITSDKRLFCNVCGQQLLSDHSCGKCGIFYSSDDAKHEVKIMGLDGREPGPQPRTIPIAFIDNKTQKAAGYGPYVRRFEKAGLSHHELFRKQYIKS